ncbi:MAG: hypothetical protein KDD69_17770, partial [Bdellovibrionales bacterium]|nr:hypothetical protein [Bdellovibrionales bacterium]
AYLHQNFESLQNATSDGNGTANYGISKKDIEKFQGSYGARREVVLDTLGIAYRTQRSQQEGVCYDLYAHPHSPEFDITPNAVRQGTIGNCYFLAAVAALADERPAAIKNMIRDNRNGTYTVRFPGDRSHSVTVNAPTEAEMGLYNAGSDTGTWPIILEKAYGKYRQDMDAEPRGLTPAEGADGGGLTSQTLELLTAKESSRTMTEACEREALSRTLQRALDRGAPITANTPAKIGRQQEGGETTKDGFYRAHAYTVLDFDPTGPDGGTVRIRNPWGGTDGTTKGTIDITLEQFRENFRDLVISS